MTLTFFRARTWTLQFITRTKQAPPVLSIETAALVNLRLNCHQDVTPAKISSSQFALVRCYQKVSTCDLVKIKVNLGCFYYKIPHIYLPI